MIVHVIGDVNFVIQFHFYSNRRLDVIKVNRSSLALTNCFQFINV